MKEKVIKQGKEYTTAMREIEKELKALMEKHNVQSYACVLCDDTDTWTLTRIVNTDVKSMCAVTLAIAKYLSEQV